MRFHALPRGFAALMALLSLLGAPAAAQLGSRPAEEWIQTLDGPARVSGLKIDEIVAALKLSPGQIVADIGAGSGLFSAPMAKAVAPNGRVYAVEIDAGFFPQIEKRAEAAQATNVQTVLGKYTDPALPAKNVDLAFFHDVMHHVAQRDAYIKSLAGYMAPSGRVAIIDYEAGQGPHSAQPELQVSREQLSKWMQAVRFTQVEDVKLFPDKYFLIFARR
jgi:FkbM family methyltransferase